MQIKMTSVAVQKNGDSAIKFPFKQKAGTSPRLSHIISWSVDVRELDG